MTPSREDALFGLVLDVPSLIPRVVQHLFTVAKIGALLVLILLGLNEGNP